MDSYINMKVNSRNISLSALSCLVFLYFSRSSFINFARLLRLSTTFVAGLIMLPFLAILVVYTFRSIKHISWDGIAVIAINAAFFIWTINAHPEYQIRFEDLAHDGRYSAAAAFSLGAGIYAYYVIRLLQREPDKLYNCFRVLAYVIFFLNIGTMLWNRTEEYKMDFGYQMEIVAILFISEYLFDSKNSRNMRKLFFSIVSIVAGVLYGSRACIIGYVVFIGLFFIWQHKLNTRQLIIVVLTMLAAVTVSSSAIMTVFYNFFSSLGLHSRTLFYLAQGDIFAVDTARQDRIWPKLIQELSESSVFKIRGAYGGRYLLNSYWPYEHNLILELLLSFGVVIGGIMIIWVLIKTIRVLQYEKGSAGLLLLVFGTFSICRLMVSSSFWYEPYFWAYLAQLANCSHSIKESKRNRGLDFTRYVRPENNNR